MKLQEIKMKKNSRSCFFVTIPISLVRAKRWQARQELKAEFDKQGNIVLKENILRR